MMQDTETRNPDGTFAKGASGNPSGRARLSPELRAMLSNNAEKAIGAIVRNLDDPDPRIALKAAEMLLDRHFGKPQNASESIELADVGDTSSADGLLKFHAALIAATASGNVALSDAKEFSSLLEGHRRFVEVSDLEARISKLEKEGPK